MGKDNYYLQDQLTYVYNGKNEFIPSKTLFSSKPTVIAGFGSKRKIDVVGKLISKYGGDSNDWRKMAAKIKSGKYTFDVHWYEKDGKQYNMKMKFRKENN